MSKAGETSGVTSKEVLAPLEDFLDGLGLGLSPTLFRRRGVLTKN